ncbi:MAG: hypothetical protein K5891_11945 [Lachnospiraceae bacterium]|nr:hypothetical protein [Lachnospiraceae bacterium]
MSEKQMPVSPGETREEIMQSAVRSLKETAAAAKEDYRPYTTGEIVHDVIFFFITVVVAFGWLLIMLLIVSFVGMRYIHLKIGGMLIASALFSLCAAVWYGVRMVRKYRGYFARNRD